MDKIRVIEASLRCFVCGWLSLVPLVGLASSMVAITEYLFVKRLAAGQWNPARRYSRAGLVLAIGGLLLNGFPSFLFGSWILSRLADGSLSFSELLIQGTVIGASF